MTKEQQQPDFDSVLSYKTDLDCFFAIKQGEDFTIVSSSLINITTPSYSIGGPYVFNDEKPLDYRIPYEFIT